MQLTLHPTKTVETNPGHWPATVKVQSLRPRQKTITPQKVRDYSARHRLARDATETCNVSQCNTVIILDKRMGV